MLSETYFINIFCYFVCFWQNFKPSFFCTKTTFSKIFFSSHYLLLFTLYMLSLFRNFYFSIGPSRAPNVCCPNHFSSPSLGRVTCLIGLPQLMLTLVKYSALLACFLSKAFPKNHLHFSGVLTRIYFLTYNPTVTYKAPWKPYLCQIFKKKPFFLTILVSDAFFIFIFAAVVYMTQGGAWFKFGTVSQFFSVGKSALEPKLYCALIILSVGLGRAGKNFGTQCPNNVFV